MKNRLLDLIKNKIRKCLVRLYREEPNLFDMNGGSGLCERCLVFRFGIYLQEEFPGLFVDSDFNSSFVNGRRVRGKQITNPDSTKTNRFVDIIVHKRKIATLTDFICFEIKKWNNGNRKAVDKDKNILRVLTSEFGYKYGFFLILGKNLSKTKWIIYRRNHDPDPVELVFHTR